MEKNNYILSHRSATSPWELFCLLGIKTCSYHVNQGWETSQLNTALGSFLFWDICADLLVPDRGRSDSVNTREFVLKKGMFGISCQLLMLGLVSKVAYCLACHNPYRNSDLEQSTLKMTLPGGPLLIGREFASRTTECRRGWGPETRGFSQAHHIIRCSFGTLRDPQTQGSNSRKKTHFSARYPDSLPMGIVGFFRQSGVPGPWSFFPNLPAMCKTLVSSHCWPMAFFSSHTPPCSPKIVSRKGSGQPKTLRSQVPLLWLWLITASQLWFPGAEMTSRASVTQAIWTQSRSSQRCLSLALPTKAEGAALCILSKPLAPQIWTLCKEEESGRLYLWGEKHKLKKKDSGARLPLRLNDQN